MIEKYSIHNFKIHSQTDLSLAPLTLLTGINGMGKSSVMQTMLMLRESALKKELPEILNLAGENFNVGLSSSLVNWNTIDRPNILEIGITYNNAERGNRKTLRYAFAYPETEATTYLHRVAGEKQNESGLSLFTNDFQYLSAFRNGPLDRYGMDTRSLERRQLSRIMGRGEMVASFLDRYGNENIPIASLRYKDSADTSLRRQVELWLNDISPETALRIDRDGDRFKIKYGQKRVGQAVKWIDAMNTGFGISYSLVMLIALLSARPGAIILIENPEAHIHPAAQGALMRLVGMAAAAGVQIIIETHSDHIVNGALVGLKRKIMKPADLAIYYFTRDFETDNAQPIKLSIDEATCRIKDAPDGFFTQMKSDMEILFGFDDEDDE